MVKKGNKKGGKSNQNKYIRGIRPEYLTLFFAVVLTAFVFILLLNPNNKDLAGQAVDVFSGCDPVISGEGVDTLHKLYIPDDNGCPVAWFSDSGNIGLKGVMGSLSNYQVSGGESFVFENNGITLMAIDQVGNMYVKDLGQVTENVQSIQADESANEFRVKDTNDVVKILVDEAGVLSLSGMIMMDDGSPVSDVSNNIEVRFTSPNWLEDRFQKEDYVSIRLSFDNYNGEKWNGVMNLNNMLSPEERLILTLGNYPNDPAQGGSTQNSYTANWQIPLDEIPGDNYQFTVDLNFEGIGQKRAWSDTIKIIERIDRFPPMVLNEARLVVIVSVEDGEPIYEYHAQLEQNGRLVQYELQSVNGNLPENLISGMRIYINGFVQGDILYFDLLNVDINSVRDRAQSLLSDAICVGTECGDPEGTPCDRGESGYSWYGAYRDADGDGHGRHDWSNEAFCAQSGTPPDGWSTLNDDCYDSNSLAKPGATSYRSENRGDGSYDYNCDGVEEKGVSRIAGTTSGCRSEIIIADAYGWVGSVPSCGQRGDTVRCNRYFTTDCSQTTPVIQHDAYGDGCSGGITFSNPPLLSMQVFTYPEDQKCR